MAREDVIGSADRTRLNALEFGANEIVYDSIGVGAGVKAHYHRLDDKSIRINGFNAGARYLNLMQNMFMVKPIAICSPILRLRRGGVYAIVSIKPIGR